ncbi:hypothetical protein ACS6L2_02000 [Aquirufa ecclesiirivi]
MVPSLALIAATSALYKIIVAAAVPAVKEILCGDPKLVPPKVGTVDGLGELAAPENVIFLAPVYEVAVFPLAS